MENISDDEKFTKSENESQPTPQNEHIAKSSRPPNKQRDDQGANYSPPPSHQKPQEGIFVVYTSH